MRMKGKLIKWNSDKAFGFIAPNGGGEHIFIHKAALSNKKRTPKINDVITFSIAKDNNGRYCAGDATFSGEKLKKKFANKVSQFSIYLSVLFLIGITTAYFMEQLPKKLLFGYCGMSVITFFAYAFDKSKALNAEHGEFQKTHYIYFHSLVGGQVRQIAQQLLRP